MPGMSAEGHLAGKGPSLNRQRRPPHPPHLPSEAGIGQARAGTSPSTRWDTTKATHWQGMSDSDPDNFTLRSTWDPCLYTPLENEDSSSSGNQFAGATTLAGTPWAQHHKPRHQLVLIRTLGTGDGVLAQSRVGGTETKLRTRHKGSHRRET